MKSVIIITSPSLTKEVVEQYLNSNGQDTKVNLVTETTDFSQGGYFIIPNPQLPGDVLPLLELGVDIVVQRHSVGAMSVASNDLFMNEASEEDIHKFTRSHNRYKQVTAPLTTQPSESVFILDTTINDPTNLELLIQSAVVNFKLATDPVDKVETTTTDTIPEEAKVEQEEKIDFDNPKDEEEKIDSVASESPSIENVKYEQPRQVEEKVEEVKEQPPLQPESTVQQTQPESNDFEFDPMASIASKEEPALPARSEDKAPETNVDDFEKALMTSLAFATDSSAPTSTLQEEKIKKKKGRTYPIPKTYPNVDQTVTFDSAKIFMPSVNEKAPALYDWGGAPTTFNILHNEVSNFLTEAMERGIEPPLSTLQHSVFRSGDDQVSSPEMHRLQYVEGARWGSTINSKTTAVPIIMPIRDPNYGDAKYVGPESVSLIQNRMKIGAKLGVYLPHTGIYFVIVSPSDDQFLDALSIINSYRIESLRVSSGILMGNSNFYINRQVMNLFIDQIVHCSLVGFSKEKLLKLINERDINIMADALGASIYPDGYEYVQTCGLVKEDKTVCDHEVRKLLDLRRLVFVDNSRLSEAQKEHAAGALTQRSEAEILAYQQASYIGYRKPYEITEGIEFVYRAQTAMTSIEAGEKWIKEIEQIVDAIIAFREDENTRNTMIEQRINLMRIREFGHWVEEILIDGQPLQDRDKINKLLNSLSRNKSVVERVGDTLTEFQRLSSVAIVAIPRLPCVGCGKTSEKDLDVSTHLIPQDAVSRLFTLVRQRL